MLSKVHINTSLPPVGIPIKVCINNAWVPCIRGLWITKSDIKIKFLLGNNEVRELHRRKIQWKYP